MNVVDLNVELESGQQFLKSVLELAKNYQISLKSLSIPECLEERVAEALANDQKQGLNRNIEIKFKFGAWQFDAIYSRAISPNPSTSTDFSVHEPDNYVNPLLHASSNTSTSNEILLENLGKDINRAVLYVIFDYYNR